MPGSALKGHHIALKGYHMYTVKNLGNIFQHFANSQPNHLLGNIFVFCPTSGQDFPNKWATVVGQLKGHIFAQILVKIRNNYARVK